MKNLIEKLKVVKSTGPRWVLAVTPATGDVPGGGISSYVDEKTKLRIWFLHSEGVSALAEAQAAIDRFAKSGVPDLPGATITLQTADGPVTGSLQNFLEMMDLLWQSKVARELGLFGRAENLARKLDLLSTAADHGIPLTAEQIAQVEKEDEQVLREIGLVESDVRKTDTA